jgi:hypothetical protein
LWGGSYWAGAVTPTSPTGNVQLNLGPNVAAEEPEEHTGTKCETWRTMYAGRVAYTDPGPFPVAELISFSTGTWTGKGQGFDG